VSDLVLAADEEEAVKSRGWVKYGPQIQSPLSESAVDLSKSGLHDRVNDTTDDFPSQQERTRAVIDCSVAINDETSEYWVRFRRHATRYQVPATSYK
jgi:hypothetical protein